MHQLLDDMNRYRRAARRADHIDTALRLLVVVLLCLIAYSCAERDPQPSHRQGVYRG